MAGAADNRLHGASAFMTPSTSRAGAGQEAIVQPSLVEEGFEDDDLSTSDDDDDFEDVEPRSSVAWSSEGSLHENANLIDDSQRPFLGKWRSRLFSSFQPDPRWRDAFKGNIFWGFSPRRHRLKPRYPVSYGSFDGPRPAFSPSMIRIASEPSRHSAGRLTPMQPVGYRTQVLGNESNEHLARPVPPSPSVRPRRMLTQAFRPTSATIDELLSSWLKRNLVLVWLPVLLVLVWCSIPFPVTKSEEQSRLSSHLQRKPHFFDAISQADANFWFFLVWYYGCYVAVALIFITQLFTLYRLNWWPTALGPKTSYAFFWFLTIFCGYALHLLDPLHYHLGEEVEGNQWKQKAEWVLLTFATMAMPACVCFIGLRRSGRQRYRPMLAHAQKPFLSDDTLWHIPASYRRFLWFMSLMGLNLLTLLLGQGYASLYLNTLPHTGLDGTLYVALWLVTVHLLSFVTQWIISEKIRSRALLFVFRYFYFMVYFIFYRNLFARLRSFDQFALIQLLSSTWVCLWYPVSMSRLWLRQLNRFNSRQVPWEEHVEKVSLFFYLRNAAQHTTMLAFIGWLSILHFGINQPLYPFFAFDDDDPYNYKLTILGSLAIWASEFISIWITIGICWALYGINLAQNGLAEMRLYPELVPTCVWTSLHVLMNMLFFLIQLDFC
ncbi:hypothetical protein MPSI1_000724 [Malassezia psittaci]|uniref:Transmembrane protein n=1 Tax=Malassezia psittaci TaxID=1821823 RepID=A0AAF0F993_9BASI|nr:hypothetical protein MPSI1_000724 [Malassezia psittaci]